MSALNASTETHPSAEPEIRKKKEISTRKVSIFVILLLTGLVVLYAVVQAGDELFSIGERPFELALRQAEANLAATTQGSKTSAVV